MFNHYALSNTFVLLMNLLPDVTNLKTPPWLKSNCYRCMSFTQITQSICRCAWVFSFYLHHYVFIGQFPFQTKVAVLKWYFIYAFVSKRCQTCSGTLCRIDGLLIITYGVITTFCYRHCVKCRDLNWIYVLLLSILLQCSERKSSERKSSEHGVWVDEDGDTEAISNYRSLGRRVAVSGMWQGLFSFRLKQTKNLLNHWRLKINLIIVLFLPK